VHLTIKVSLRVDVVAFEEGPNLAMRIIVLQRDMSRLEGVFLIPEMKQRGGDILDGEADDAPGGERVTFQESPLGTAEAAAVYRHVGKGDRIELDVGISPELWRDAPGELLIRVVEWETRAAVPLHLVRDLRHRGNL
jgi:hypothetical protein